MFWLFQHRPLVILRFDVSKRILPSSPPPTDGIKASLRSIFLELQPARRFGGLFDSWYSMSDQLHSEVLDFGKQDGLIAAVVQDANTRRVLMVGYMNREAFDKTVSTGHVTFFSRSRQKLWTKGESSGHFLMLKGVRTDCDGDALLIEAEPIGPGVCHAGYESCFYRAYQNGAFVDADEKVYDPEAVYGAKQ